MELLSTPVRLLHTHTLRIFSILHSNLPCFFFHEGRGQLGKELSFPFPPVTTPDTHTHPITVIISSLLTRVFLFLRCTCLICPISFTFPPPPHALATRAFVTFRCSRCILLTDKGGKRDSVHLQRRGWWVILLLARSSRSTLPVCQPFASFGEPYLVGGGHLIAVLYGSVWLPTLSQIMGSQYMVSESNNSYKLGSHFFFPFSSCTVFLWGLWGR